MALAIRTGERQRLGRAAGGRHAIDCSPRQPKDDDAVSTPGATSRLHGIAERLGRSTVHVDPFGYLSEEPDEPTVWRPERVPSVPGNVWSTESSGYARATASRGACRHVDDATAIRRIVTGPAVLASASVKPAGGRT